MGKVVEGLEMLLVDSKLDDKAGEVVKAEMKRVVVVVVVGGTGVV